MSTQETSQPVTFSELGLIPALQESLIRIGYEKPSPIQLQAIPHLLEGKDLLGVAQTGTGKTAAFALPFLSRLDLSKKFPQILVLTPTRELAIQVSEAFKTYAKTLKDFRVSPIYGGQDYRTQLKQLDRGTHVIVGTPGRVMDHIRRGSLKLEQLQALVLDEADEMLRMGFIDDVEWILQHTPKERQTALFSATMPTQIRKISQKYLKEPVEVTIKVTETTAETIDQFFWQVRGNEKLDTLTRLLDAEPFDGMIVFVRTKNATLEVADRLQARGFAAEALNGDIAQNQREKIVKQIKSGNIDILVATDVAARGLDVERISHVINYDVPHDTESYVHRIGRTGRAGRSGKAILFITSRETRMLSSIERATRKTIEKYRFPSIESLNQRKMAQWFAQIDAELDTDLSEYRDIINEYLNTSDADILDIAAALGRLSQGSKNFLMVEEKPVPQQRRDRNETRNDSRGENRKDRKKDGRKDNNREKPFKEDRPQKDTRLSKKPDREKTAKDKPVREKSASGKSEREDIPMKSYRIAVGTEHGAQKGDIVGAIANEADIESKYIGKIKMQDDFSIIELPDGMPKEILKHLKKVWVKGQKLGITEINDGSSAGNPRSPRKRSAPPKD